MSPFFIVGITILLILIGCVLVDTIMNQKPEEEIIKIIDYADYDFSKLNRNGNYSYEDDKYTSMFGIDVSTFQDNIDWKKVKDAGVEFVYIRLGYRGATQGKLNVDSEFEQNYKGATENGIKVGIYWYSQPVSEAEAIEEADFVLEVLNGRKLDLPIVYDFEETHFDDGTISRMHYLNKKARTNMAIAFSEEIEKNHHDVMIYMNLLWADNYYDLSKLNDYPIWFAQYSSVPEFDKPFAMWQYSESGSIDGISTPVDLDILFIRKSDQN